MSRYLVRLIMLYVVGFALFTLSGCATWRDRTQPPELHEQRPAEPFFWSTISFDQRPAEQNGDYELTVVFRLHALGDLPDQTMFDIDVWTDTLGSAQSPHGFLYTTCKGGQDKIKYAPRMRCRIPWREFTWGFDGSYIDFIWQIKAPRRRDATISIVVRTQGRDVVKRRVRHAFQPAPGWALAQMVSPINSRNDLLLPSPERVIYSGHYVYLRVYGCGDLRHEQYVEVWEQRLPPADELRRYGRRLNVLLDREPQPQAHRVQTLRLNPPDSRRACGLWQTEPFEPWREAHYTFVAPSMSIAQHRVYGPEQYVGFISRLDYHDPDGMYSLPGLMNHR